MEVHWHWQRKISKFKNAICIKNLKTKIKKKEGKNYVLWRIWWTICTTRIKRKIR